MTHDIQDTEKIRGGMSWAHPSDLKRTNIYTDSQPLSMGTRGLISRSAPFVVSTVSRNMRLVDLSMHIISSTPALPDDT